MTPHYVRIDCKSLLQGSNFKLVGPLFARYWPHTNLHSIVNRLVFVFGNWRTFSRFEGRFIINQHLFLLLSTYDCLFDKEESHFVHIGSLVDEDVLRAYG